MLQLMTLREKKLKIKYKGVFADKEGWVGENRKMAETWTQHTRTHTHVYGYIDMCIYVYIYIFV